MNFPGSNPDLIIISTIYLELYKFTLLSSLFDIRTGQSIAVLYRQNQGKG